MTPGSLTLSIIRSQSNDDIKSMPERHARASCHWLTAVSCELPNVTGSTSVRVRS